MSRLDAYFRAHRRVAVAVGALIILGICALDVARVWSVRNEWPTSQLMAALAVGGFAGAAMVPGILLVLRPSLRREDLEGGSLLGACLAFISTWLIAFSLTHNRFDQGDDSLNTLWKVGVTAFADVYLFVFASGVVWLSHRYLQGGRRGEQSAGIGTNQSSHL